MKICGVKLTHDGAVAMLDDNRLVFSWEMEKIANGERYAKIDDLSMVYQILERNGVGDVDLMVFDGWHRTHRTHMWSGQEVAISLAPYRRGIVGNDPLMAYPGTVFDLAYLSYAHYSTHLASSYCTSPFAAKGEDAFCMVWDAHMFPYLYHVAHRDGTVTSIGPLCHLIATAYFRLANKYAPFNQDIVYPAVLGISGKIMAYVALGKVQQEALHLFEHAYDQACREVLGEPPAVSDHYLQANTGEHIAVRMMELVNDIGISDADMLMSLHTFFEQQLLRGLAQRLAAYPQVPRQLCLAGGAALNIKWNRAIRSSELVEAIWIPPFPNDAGSAIGAACCAMLRKTAYRSVDWRVYTGPPLNLPQVLPGWQAEPTTITQLARIMAKNDQPIVFLSGCAELGPRALGHRSIFAPATSVAMKARLNVIKEREWYRPIAPICLEQWASDIFSPGMPDPYMLFDHIVRPAWRDKIPAVCHLDGTARLQTVNVQQEPHIFALLTEYAVLTGIPLLCNTSANLKGHGFFPDVQSAMLWGRISLIWSDGILYSQSS